MGEDVVEAGRGDVEVVDVDAGAGEVGDDLGGGRRRRSAVNETLTWSPPASRSRVRAGATAGRAARSGWWR